MNLHWFSSTQFRRTSEMWRNLQKIRDAQSDLLPPENLQSLDTILQQTKTDLDLRADDQVLATRAEEMELAAQNWLQPYPNAEWRDNIEVLLVAIALAMAIRTFFTQPFKIPTGSMQPTLNGVTIQDLREDRAFVMPGFLARAFDVAVFGAIYHQVIATADCEFDHADPLHHVAGVINKQLFWIRYANGLLAPITLYCGPDDDGYESVSRRIGLRDDVAMPRQFHKGEPILQFVEHAGDHLFVNRLTYNFRHPQRGEIVVFKTRNIPKIGTDQFYIKRLIGLPDETITIGEDRHVRVNGVRLDTNTPHFEKIYAFDPATPPHENRYSGHTLQNHLNWLLKTPSDRLHVRPKHYAVFGDNTENSSDSRYWGDFPETDLMGQAWLVYWPFSSRFGFTGNR
jgi:signal peptidase I